jgi:hypothetical protein
MLEFCITANSNALGHTIANGGTNIIIVVARPLM